MTNQHPFDRPDRPPFEYSHAVPLWKIALQGFILIVVVAGLGFAMLVSIKKPLCQLSTATMEAGSDAPVPVGYPDKSEVV